MADPMRTSSPDAIVIGSGPNGLVAANELADAGWSTLVLEASEEPGGAVRSGELTLPGFRHDLFSAFYPLAVASPAFVRLGLEAEGLRWRRAPLALAHLLADGSCAVVSTDLEETCAALDALEPGDGAAWRTMIEEWDSLESPLLAALFHPFPPVRPLARLVRRLGPLGLERLARQALLPVRRMTEERFRGEGARLLLGGCSLHTDLGPEAAGSGFYGWLLCCLAQRHGFPVPEGGAASLSAALIRRLERRGGAIRCGATVAEVLVEHGRATGVRTVSGEVLRARRAVVADVPAPTLYRELLSPSSLPAGVIADLGRFQWDMGTVKVDWALSSPIPWSAAPASRAGTVHVADDFDNLTQFAGEIAMGRLPSRPFLVVGQQSLADPTRSPPGTETAWAYTHVPRRLRGDGGGEVAVDPSGGDGWVEAFVARIEARIEGFAPGFSERILARHVLGPEQMAARNPSLVGGAIGGGTSQLHQQLFLRPIPGTGRAETPVAGLYLASSSAHPGGGVHGGAGSNAARAARAPAPRLRSRFLGRGGGRPARRGYQDAEQRSARP